MHIHVLGVCGTFMGSLAQLAKALGHRVTGSDAAVYPPMSTQLANAGIEIIDGYDPSQLNPPPDLVVVGNAMSRGNPVVEALLNSTIPYVSGPQWLHDFVLPEKWVLAVAGTHGKTTTSSMLAWILEYAGMAPGYLIGGVPGNFEHSARLGETPFFVVEADEYDTAFFDKRSKFVHYQPRTVILNNLEFDHADIFPNLEAIQTQFHHLMRIVPSNGLVIRPKTSEALDTVVERGCWTPLETTGTGEGDADWEVRFSDDGGHGEQANASAFEIFYKGSMQGTVTWSLTGMHNVQNALAAIAAARHVGVESKHAIDALCEFQGVKRRMENLGTFNGVTVYDDFAHHPTAIKTTLAGLRAKVGQEKIIALIEPRSNTMRLGTHRDKLPEAVSEADEVIWFQPPGLDWSLATTVTQSSVPARVESDLQQLVKTLAETRGPAHIVIMSNGGFGGVHQKLVDALQQ